MACFKHYMFCSSLGSMLALAPVIGESQVKVLQKGESPKKQHGFGSSWPRRGAPLLSLLFPPAVKDYKAMPHGPGEQFHTADDAGDHHGNILVRLSRSLRSRLRGLRGFFIRYFFYAAWPQRSCDPIAARTAEMIILCLLMI